MIDLKSQLPALLPLAIAWAQAEETRVLAGGLSLTTDECAMAENVGVLHPQRVRVELVERIPAPAEPRLREAIRQTAMLGPETRGLTLGYAIFVQRDARSRRLLSHELRHVYQYERAGSIAAFLPVYLGQVVEIGYRDSPLEVDARAHECAE